MIEFLMKNGTTKNTPISVIRERVLKDSLLRNNRNGKKSIVMTADNLNVTRTRMIERSKI